MLFFSQENIHASIEYTIQQILIVRSYLSLDQVPKDQIGVGIFYNDRTTRRLTGTLGSTLDIHAQKEKTNCVKCN